MKIVSLVVPVYNEEEMFPLFIAKAKELFINNENYHYEFLFINDGSKDKTLELLKKAQKEIPNISVVSFSRNFGHEAALEAGIKHAIGDVVIPLDCDLQDPPELIFEMLKLYELGYDVVNAKRRTRRGDGLLKKVTANKFYNILEKLTGKVKVPNNVGNFRLMSRRVVDALNALPERKRVFRAEVPFIGFKTTTVEFDRPERAAGKTHYNYSQMFTLAGDTISISSTKILDWPLKIGIGLTTIFGLLFAASLALFICQSLIFEFLVGIPFQLLTIMTLILMVLGVISLLIYIPCIYLKVIMANTQNRPNFQVEYYKEGTI